MKRRRQNLEMLLFKKAVDEFANMGGTIIDFNTTIGEPMLDPYLLERARYVSQFLQFKSLGFVTTLQYLDRFEMDEFFESGITWMAVSTVLSGREKYFEFFGVDKYDSFLKNMLMFIEENNKRKGKINIYIDIKPTNEAISDVINHPDFKMINSILNQDLVKTVTNRGQYCDDWIGAVNLPDYLKKRPLYPKAFRPCALIYSSLIIYSDGNVGSCACRDFEANSGLILGNIKESALWEMWNGEKLALIRSNWKRKNRIPNICKSCRHYLY